MTYNKYRFINWSVIFLIFIAVTFFCHAEYYGENIKPNDDGSQCGYGEKVGGLNSEALG